MFLILLPFSAVVGVKHLTKLLELGCKFLLGGPDGDAVDEELAVLGGGGGHVLVSHVGDIEECGVDPHWLLADKHLKKKR